ncbi:amino acid carrier family protein, partial [Vibrio parahaemolyticus VPTS-2010]
HRTQHLKVTFRC